MKFCSPVEGIKVYRGDCTEILPQLKETVDAVITDPPYGLEFMGSDWDKLGKAHKRAKRAKRANELSNPVKAKYLRHSVEYVGGKAAGEWHKKWAIEVLRVLRPGGYMLCFGGTRTYHRLACAVEDAGFRVKDCLMWLYFSGFPKGAGCLKPAYESILLCYKPGKKVQPLGIDDCGIAINKQDDIWVKNPHTLGGFGHGRAVIYGKGRESLYKLGKGRWPANVVHDGSEEVMEVFAKFGESKSIGGTHIRKEGGIVYGGGDGMPSHEGFYYGDSGDCSRLFYCAKASRQERETNNNHPTVKPVKLIKWLIKLICPEDGLVLDPFLGSGTTALVCSKIKRCCIGIEKNHRYYKMACSRIKGEEIELEEGKEPEKLSGFLSTSPAFCLDT